MTQTRKFAYNAQPFNEWHRAASLRRFGVSAKDAALLGAYDGDLIEVVVAGDDYGRPVLRYEVTEERGQDKQTTFLRQDARRSNCVAMELRFRPSATHNPTTKVPVPDIDSFRFRRIWPSPEPDFTEMPAADFARYIVNLVNRLKAHPVVGALRTPSQEAEFANAVEAVYGCLHLRD